jgi:hypothetical protein
VQPQATAVPLQPPTAPAQSPSVSASLPAVQAHTSPDYIDANSGHDSKYIVSIPTSQQSDTPTVVAYQSAQDSITASNTSAPVDSHPKKRKRNASVDDLADHPPSPTKRVRTIAPRRQRGV